MWPRKLLRYGPWRSRVPIVAFPLRACQWRGIRCTGAVVTAQPVTTAHRRGLRTSFLAASQGPRAGWEEVVRAAQNHADGDAVALTTRILTRQWDRDGCRIQLHDDGVGDLVAPPVENLMEVRRPLSYRGMKSYIGRMCVPSSDGSGRGVWFESRNEQDNYRDFLICHDVTEMATQPLRFEWTWDC